MNRYVIALATEIRREPREPYHLLRSAWLVAIAPYKIQEPPLHDFYVYSGVIEIACRVYALFPLAEAAQYAATMTAAISYPAYGETTEGQKAWAVLGNTLDAIVLAPEPFNRGFQERNPMTFDATFSGIPFTAAEANDMLMLLLRFVQRHGVRLR